MASRSFLPEADGALAAWARNFVQHIQLAPESLGIPPAQAAEFAELSSNYDAALQMCQPQIRNIVSTSLKNDVRRALKQAASRLSQIVQGQADVSDAQKTELGLNVRAARVCAPRPGEAPVVRMTAEVGWTMKVSLSEPTISRRGRPAGVAGAAVFAFVGEMPPSDLSEWRFVSNVGRTTLDVDFPATLPPGARVWVTACWFNGRKQSGPLSTPVSNTIRADSVAMTKLAA